MYTNSSARRGDFTVPLSVKLASTIGGTAGSEKTSVRRPINIGEKPSACKIVSQACEPPCLPSEGRGGHIDPFLPSTYTDFLRYGDFYEEAKCCDQPRS